MVDNCTGKLPVEVCNAKNLMPKDGQRLHYRRLNGQPSEPRPKFRDRNPQWDGKMKFLVHDKDPLATEILEINLYNDKKTSKQSPFLGTAKLAGTTFIQSG